MWPFGSSKSASNVAGTGSPRQGEPGADACPVDESTRRAWLAKQSGSGDDSASGSSNTSSAYALLNAKREAHQTISSDSSGLSRERVISSIPRWIGGEGGDAGPSSPPPPSPSSPQSSNWVYPSPSQFYSAMSRKNHNPRAQDMNVVVPIHNAVNERAWQAILEWERLADEQSWPSCGGPKLVSFKGRPKDVTWKAWSRSLIGYQLPFDRHDWEIDRCGRRVRYVIDFYTGRSDGTGPSGLSFYLDVRPSPAHWEGWRMRMARVWKSVVS